MQVKFIPRGLPRDKAMGDYQGGEAQPSPLGELGVYTPGELIIKTDSAMQNFGAAISLVAAIGSVIYLSGELGVGKTTMVRGFLHGLGYLGHVRSPTYTLLETYTFPLKMIHHFDLYRMVAEEEFLHIGGRDYFTTNSICLIEWPERCSKILPPADLNCNFGFVGQKDERVVKLTANSNLGMDIIEKLKDAKV